MNCLLATLAEVIPPLSPLERTFFSLHLGDLHEMKLVLHVNNRVADINLLTTERELKLARQFWFSILQPLNLSYLVPRRAAGSFAD